MDKRMFAELVESIEEMGASLRGEILPERLKTRTVGGYQPNTIMGADDASPPATEPDD